MTRMAGSVRTTRMALTIGLRLSLGMLGCSGTGRCWPDLLVMSPESAATLALRSDWDTISRSPHPGSPSPAARRYLHLRQGPGRSSCARRLGPGAPLAFVHSRAGCFDGMPDGQSGGGCGAGGKGTRKWGSARTAKRKGGAGKSNSSEFVLASQPTPGGSRPVAVIVQGGAAAPLGGPVGGPEAGPGLQARRAWRPPLSGGEGGDGCFHSSPSPKWQGLPGSKGRFLLSSLSA